MSKKNKLSEPISIPKILATFNSNGTVLVTFTPSESTWEFPKNNRLSLFNKLHHLVTLGAKCEEYADEEFIPRKSFSLEELELEIKNLLVDWIGRGELTIK